VHGTTSATRGIYRGITPDAWARPLSAGGLVAFVVVVLRTIIVGRCGRNRYWPAPAPAVSRVVTTRLPRQAGLPSGACKRIMSPLSPGRQGLWTQGSRSSAYAMDKAGQSICPIAARR
jgi:hypothetical protein